jgi:3-hydroxy-3-methylglutaryl CoA synthase
MQNKTAPITASGLIQALGLVEHQHQFDMLTAKYAEHKGMVSAEDQAHVERAFERTKLVVAGKNAEREAMRGHVA